MSESKPITELSREEAISALQKMYHINVQLQEKLTHLYNQKTEHPWCTKIRTIVNTAGMDHVPWLDDAVSLIVKERDSLRQHIGAIRAEANKQVNEITKRRTKKEEKDARLEERIAEHSEASEKTNDETT